MTNSQVCQGQSVADAVRSIGVTEVTYYRWRREYGGLGTVAIKYRDPNNRDNTWTGRGRMPRWMAAATKGGKAKKEDFMV